MRITQSMISNNMLRNVSQSYGTLDKYMNQLSTGKKINRPSDDPVIAMRGISYRSELSKVQQYERNIGEVHSWMDKDRKSTRLNSSHVAISYAVFCLKK